MVKYSFKQILVIWKIQIDYYWYYYLSNAAVSDKSFFLSSSIQISRKVIQIILY